MHGDVGRVRHQPPGAIEQGAGKIEPLADVHRAAALLQPHPHLLGDRREAVVVELQPDWIDTGLNHGVAFLAPRIGIPMSGMPVNGMPVIRLCACCRIALRLRIHSRRLQGRRRCVTPRSPEARRPVIRLADSPSAGADLHDPRGGVRVVRPPAQILSAGIGTLRGAVRIRRGVGQALGGAVGVLDGAVEALPRAIQLLYSLHRTAACLVRDPGPRGRCRFSPEGRPRSSSRGRHPSWRRLGRPWSCRCPIGH